jgi:RND superfamily putative drug exporter
MNLLSLSVCFGMLVFIFQDGHLSSFLGFKALGFTDLNLPILLFFVLFGLSMDYEVFLLTRIKEYYERTGDNTKSVAMGLERSARIITSAALIMVIVTGAFVSADIVFIKAFGLGSALAIAIDATLIRLMLVPSTMRLLGDWNWYIPKWLDRILPDLHFDKESVCFVPDKPVRHKEKVTP